MLTLSREHGTSGLRSGGMHWAPGASEFYAAASCGQWLPYEGATIGRADWGPEIATTGTSALGRSSTVSTR